MRERRTRSRSWPRRGGGRASSTGSTSGTRSSSSARSRSRSRSRLPGGEPERVAQRRPRTRAAAEQLPRRMRLSVPAPSRRWIAIVPETPVAVLHRGTETWLVSARARVIARLVPGARPLLPRIWVPTAAPVTVGSFLVPDYGGTAARTLGLVQHFPARIATATLAHGELTFALRSGVEVRFGAPMDVRL